MKKLSYLLSIPNLAFSLIYVVAFIFSFTSVLITCDEYNGGSPVAEFGTTFFHFYGFPIFTVMETFDFSFSSEYNWLILTLFVLNIGINYLLTSFLVYRILKWINRVFIRKSH